jgi:hypothetical protein
MAGSSRIPPYQWKGLTLKAEGQVDGMKIYEGDFKQGENDFFTVYA